MSRRAPDIEPGGDAVPTFWCVDCQREKDGQAHADGRCATCHEQYEEFLENARSARDPRH